MRACELRGCYLVGKQKNPKVGYYGLLGQTTYVVLPANSELFCDITPNISETIHQEFRHMSMFFRWVADKIL